MTIARSDTGSMDFCDENVLTSCNSASIATLIRIKYLVALGSYEDNLYTATPALVWTLVEPGVAITAASLITIRPLLRAWGIAGFGSNGTGPSRLPGYTNDNTGRGGERSGGREGREMTGTNDFSLKSWNHISAGSGMEGKERTETTIVGDDGSEEYILQRQTTVTGGGDDGSKSHSRGESRNGKREREADLESLSEPSGIRRTVVVRIQSSPGIMAGKEDLR